MLTPAMPTEAQDVYCLNADGALLDAALLAAVAALADCELLHMLGRLHSSPWERAREV